LSKPDKGNILVRNFVLFQPKITSTHIHLQELTHFSSIHEEASCNEAE